MKRLHFVFLAALASAVLAGCGGPGGGKDDPTPQTVSITVSPTTLSFNTSESSTQSLSVSSNGKWTVSVESGGSWCRPDVYSGNGNATVQVTAVANNTTEPRSTAITFSGAGGAKATVTVTQIAGQEDPVRTETVTLSASPKEWDGVKRAGITYQLLAYSFADSDSNGWGDLKGIEQHLDYIDGLGAGAIWLSPIQSASSYHGYDVNDYEAIDSRYGSETDFKNLIGNSGTRGIDIYMDYVLNHSGNGTKWFLDVLSNPAGSPYKDYYVLSSNPAADESSGRIDNYGGVSTHGMGGWHEIAGFIGRLHFLLDWTGSKKTITVTATTAPAEDSNPSASKWLWIGDEGAVGLYETSTGIFEITLDVRTSWGFLVKTDRDQWGNHKWGAPSGAGSIVFGTPFTLAQGENSGNITFNNGGYSYFASFDASMPDLNYGPASSASSSACFQALATSADKWIDMGVNGFRLDAVLWIYNKQTAANVSFLRQWYDHCNATWQARGGDGNIYMVGEAFEEAGTVAPYYEGLPSLFDFSYWWTLKDRINGSKGNDFASTIIGFRNSYKSKRAGFIDAIKLSNHDEDRAANDLGRNLGKEKLAAAVLLTSPGKPFIYQGEELGYWGTKSGGDEFIRTPIKWTRSGSVPTAALNGNVDDGMLTADISVEAQSSDANSLLNLYRTFAKLRNTYPSLANGEMSVHPTYNSSNTSFPMLGVWYMTYGSEKTLVVHNFRSSQVTASFGTEDLSRPVGLNGTTTLTTKTENGTLTDNSLTLSAYGTAVFLISE